MSKINGTASSAEYRLDDMTKDEKQNISDASSEHDALVRRSLQISTPTAYKLRTAILAISWLSVVYLGIMGIIVFAMAFVKRNSTAFAFSLDALLDCASSAVVIWRYWGSAASLYSLKRERIGCIILGLLFIASSVSICTRSIFSIVSQEHPKRSYPLWVISFINAVICVGFTVSKSVLASKLESVTIATDAVNSGIGIVIATSTVISDWIYASDPSVWFLDSVIGIICSVFLLAYGIWVIVYQMCFEKSNEIG